MRGRFGWFLWGALLLGVFMAGFAPMTMATGTTAKEPAGIKAAFVQNCVGNCDIPSMKHVKGMRQYCSAVCSCSWDGLVKEVPPSQFATGLNQTTIKKVTEPCIQKHMPTLKKLNGQG